MHDNGQLKKLTCTILKNNDSSNLEVLRPNHPITLGGGKIFPVTKMHGNAIRFQAIYANGHVSEGSVNFPVGSDHHSFVIPGTTELVQVHLVHEKGSEVLLSWSGMTRKLLPGDLFRINNVQLKYLESVPWVGMILSRDPGKPYVYFGFILTAIGIVVYYVFKEKR